MRLYQLLFTFAVVFLFNPSAVCEEAAPDSDEADVIQEFIKYRYFVIGGGLRDGEVYRAQVRIFEEAGRLMIERSSGTRSEIVELLRSDGKEGQATWKAKFPNLKVNVSYVVCLYHDNFAVLVGEVMRTDRTSENSVTVETAYPDIYEIPEAEQAVPPKSDRAGG